MIIYILFVCYKKKGEAKGKFVIIISWLYFSSGKSKKPTFSYAKSSQIHTNFRLKTETAIE